MIQVTERAKEELKRVLSTDGIHTPRGVRRLSASSDKFVMRRDTEMPGDQIVKYKGTKVLLVEKSLATSLEGRTLDFQDTAEGRQFVVLKPGKRP